mmetsp:Transcript_16846/g.30510  ORF Transcript_16846/g.30510 Transcript_16846/m.30510 type:complete len:968 (+) Transcript_16846:51-2954(+)
MERKLIGNGKIIDLSRGGEDEPAAVIDVDAVGNETTVRQQPTPSDQQTAIDVDNPSKQQSDEKRKVVLTEKVSQEERRKRRRMMRQMLQPGGIEPSFVALVTPIDFNEMEEAPKRIRIDIDEYLGLKKKKPDPMPSNVSSNSSIVQAVAALPSDEGWFEGVKPVALPGEESLLSELQVLIRSNLEYFSATNEDVSAPQPGRRTRTVRGKVGVRCIHCARAIKGNPALPWPSASVSYPLNILGIYPSCTQRPQLHFQKCPHMPQDIKAHLHRLMFDEEGNTRSRSRAPRNEGMSTVMYYTISAKMIGLVDVTDGMRFGRDLTLEPLPMETVKAQIEDTQTPYKRGGGAISQVKPAPVLSNEPRITADLESERELAKAVAEKDHDLLLAKSDDKKLVTDFIFLCIKQMAVCHAVPSDFATRGKKTKMMRVGFAGFCCRHCCHFKAEDNFVHIVEYSCRSFSSAADNLASAISNSFYIHVQKCPAAPLPIRNALAVYKRLHSRQMSRLQYGSQRRLFQLLWNRLRAADMSKEELEDRLKNAPQPPEAILPSITDVPTPPDTSISPNDAQPDTAPSSLPETRLNRQFRGAMPVCEDDEANRVLKNMAENWDPVENDNLILPADRDLVTDFVFLTMRQLKAAHPLPSDFSRSKRSTIDDSSQVGVKCIHCANKADPFFKTAVGRSFPSAPDNMSSTLNSSMFQHLQKCPYVPEDVKRALVRLKMIHSAQCASLRFGSQRRFFNLVFERLKDAPNDESDNPVQDGGVYPALHGQSMAPTPVSEADDMTLAQNGFIETKEGCFECQFCRMVPFSLRAPDSLAIDRPQVDYILGHQRVCAKDQFDLSNAVEALKAFTESYPSLIDGAVLSMPTFVSVICAAVSDEIGKVIIEGLKDVFAVDRNDKASQSETRGLWNKFPASPDFDKVATAFKEFADTVPSMGSELVEEKGFQRFLQILSPSLIITSALATNETKE